MIERTKQSEKQQMVCACCGAKWEDGKGFVEKHAYGRCACQRYDVAWLISKDEFCPEKKETVMNALIWNLPAFIHTLLLRLTGWRLVRFTSNGVAQRYLWSRCYPPKGCIEL